MLSVLCAVNFPVDCTALGILLEEREKAEALDAYRGDLLWSVLCSIHRIAGSEATIPSYSEMLGLVDRGRTSKRKAITNDDVRRSVSNTLRRFGAAK